MLVVVLFVCDEFGVCVGFEWCVDLGGVWNFGDVCI